MSACSFHRDPGGASLPIVTGEVQGRQVRVLVDSACTRSMVERHVGKRLGLQCQPIQQVLGMVNATPDFAEHPKVINGCSDLLGEILGDRGVHSRSAVGMGSLPGGITVEIEAIIAIRAE